MLQPATLTAEQSTLDYTLTNFVKSLINFPFQCTSKSIVLFEKKIILCEISFAFNRRDNLFPRAADHESDLSEIFYPLALAMDSASVVNFASEFDST